MDKQKVVNALAVSQESSTLQDFYHQGGEEGLPEALIRTLVIKGDHISLYLAQCIEEVAVDGKVDKEILHNCISYGRKRLTRALHALDSANAISQLTASTGDEEQPTL